MGFVLWVLIICIADTKLTTSTNQGHLDQPTTWAFPFYAEYFGHYGITNVIIMICEGAPYHSTPLVRYFTKLNFYVRVVTDGDTNLGDVLKPSTYKTGILLSLDDSCAQTVLEAAYQSNLFKVNHFWLLLTEHKIIPDIFIPPDGEVRVMFVSEKLSLFDIYKIHPKMPLKISRIGENISTVKQLSERLQRFGSAISQRENLEGQKFNTGLVIAFPDVFTYMADLGMRHMDTIARVHFPLTKALGLKLNMTFNTYQLDNFGWMNPDGTFSGLVGRFERSEVDFAQTALFMRLERMRSVDFVAETYRFRAGFMFRQPPLSAVANIFALPFNKDVWISVLVFVILTALVMLIELIFSKSLFNVDLTESIVFAWGALCQQGFHINVSTRSARILVFTTFVTSLFLFTSFSANIVALLQSPSEAIKTLRDLSQSPLEIGIQDTVYNHIFFNESTDKVTRLIYLKKIQPKGDMIFLKPGEGISKMRNGLFAFQVELHTAYQIISDTFSEMEKCGLTDLEPFKLPVLGIPVRKGFPYKELFRRQLRWLREVGVMNREQLKWLPQRPKCESGAGGFISIGLTECRYPFAIMGYGLGFSALVLLAEYVAKYVSSKASRKRLNILRR